MQIKKNFPHIYQKYSENLNENEISQGIYVAQKNITKTDKGDSDIEIKKQEIKSQEVKKQEPKKNKKEKAKAIKKISKSIISKVKSLGAKKSK